MTPLVRFGSGLTAQTFLPDRAKENASLLAKIRFGADDFKSRFALTAAAIAQLYSDKAGKPLPKDYETYLSEVVSGPSALVTASVGRFPPLPANKPLYFIAEGSSKLSGEMVETLYEQAGYSVRHFSPDQFSLKLANNPDFLASGHVVFISQSGNTGALKRLVEQHGIQNAFVVTNTPGSYLNQTFPDTTMLLNAGKEASIPSTKAVLATVGALAGWLSASGRVSETLPDVAQHMNGILQNPDLINTLIQWGQALSSGKLPHKANTVLLSNEENKPVLQEQWLKLRETSGIALEASNLETFQHGPKTLLAETPNLLVVLPRALADASESIKQLQTLLISYRNATGQPYPGKNIFLIADEQSAPLLKDLPATIHRLVLPKAPSTFAYQMGVLQATQLLAAFTTHQNNLPINSPFLGKVVG